MCDEQPLQVAIYKIKQVIKFHACNDYLLGTLQQSHRDIHIFLAALLYIIGTNCKCIALLTVSSVYMIGKVLME